MKTSERTLKETDIAIIGMAGRFPDAESIEAYWRNLLDGKESITREKNQGNKHIHAAGLLEHVYCFDHDFFNIPDADAMNMDPQYRMILENTYHALEDAGYADQGGDRNIGLFIGADETFYVWNQFYNKLIRNEAVNRIGMFLENTLTTRVSHKLNLTGPSVAVRASCATSNVAVHYAILSLLYYDCNMSLAGGVNIKRLEEGYQVVQGMSSSYGELRAYDEAGDGFVPGNGMGTVVLKRLEDALADKDHIYAIITGSSVVNDGNRKAGYHASSVEGESEAIIKAMVMAERKPEDICCIEGHGTATVLGDSVEIRAIHKAYTALSSADYRCALGSAKTNIGHLNTAAGIAGLMKGILTVYHGVFPPSLNYEKPNPELRKVEQHLFVNTQQYPLPEDKLRVVGVSSFGFGGVNSHIIVEEAPEPRPVSHTASYYLLPVCGKTRQAAEQNMTHLKQFLEQSHINQASASYTLWTGRQKFNYRGYLITAASGEIVAESSILDSSLKPEDHGLSCSGKNEWMQTPVRELTIQWMTGQSVDYMSLFADIPYKVPLPVYAFEKNEFKPEHLSFTPETQAYCIVDGLNDRNYQLTKFLSTKKNTSLTLIEQKESSKLCSLAVTKESLRQQLKKKEKQLLSDQNLYLLHQREDWQSKVDYLCFLSVEKYLSQYELFRHPQQFHIEEARQALNIIEPFYDFFDFILNVVEKTGYLKREDKQLTILQPLRQTEKLELAMKAFEQTVPWGYKIMQLLVHCTKHYKKAFTGEMPSNEVLYPGGSYELLQSIERNGTTELHYCQLAAELIDKLADNSKDVVHILEIGGGTGELTDYALEKLKGKRVQYYFTDVGASFISAYRKKTGNNQDNWISFSKLDITRDFSEQGIADQSMDLIIGANVMQATSCMKQVMENCQKALVDGGYICMVQLYRIHDLQQLIFGLSPGWWNYKKDSLPRSGPYFTLQQWHDFYNEAGLVQVESYPAVAEEYVSNTALLIGQKAKAEAPSLQPNTDKEKQKRLDAILAGNSKVNIEYVAAYDHESMLSFRTLWLQQHPMGEWIATEQLEEVFCQHEIGGEANIKQRLQTIVTDILDLQTIDDEHFIDAFDSLSILILSGEIKEQFQVETKADTLYAMTSLSELADYIEEKRKAGVSLTAALDEVRGSKDEGDTSLLFEEL